jgi:hypothetical protein
MAESGSPPLDVERVDSSDPPAETAVCLFAFGEVADALSPPEATLERRLLWRRVGSVTALVGLVPLLDYRGADGEGPSGDIAWLAPRARRHAELVAWMAQRSAVFPAPFATLYASLDSLTAFMRTHEATIAAFLRAVADKEEWELRAAAHFDDPGDLDRLACEAWPDWRNLSKGARYLRLCRDKRVLVDFGRAKAAAQVDALVAELGALTGEARSLAPSRAPDPDGGEPVARYALLVAKRDVAALQARVAQAAARARIAVKLSGPWPPFSFRPNLPKPNELNRDGA